ncbi:putative Nudix hydrolase [Spirochaetia bacterium]|nr:putative Nudix hydrolase [Spirochaetia bacterium]
MEYWDLYDKTRRKLDKIHLRGEKVNPGEYYIVVSGWIINDENKILLTQRHPEKTFPLTWECNKGAVITGEDSFNGVLREVEEEIGIKLRKENGVLIDTYIGNDFIKDIYLFKENVDIEKTKLQEKEVVNIKWVTIKEFDEMTSEGKIGPSAISDMERIKLKIKLE